MAKKIKRVVKLKLNAGKATPAPPVGTSLGPTGINLAGFCKEYNDLTRDKVGTIIPVELTIYEDCTYSIQLKTPPTSSLLKQAARISKGSGTTKRDIVGTITKTQLKDIAEIKMPDLTAASLEAAMSMIEGTAKSMGIKVTDD
ncbi:50S ribosomal protein L11 [Luxibacter massiliensis]|uniref:50S ribosomal protein L11 n=1 Tax=Luxibacter massiliensis TaxID=2219695 RepID=UPI000F05BEF8|nr:50S ribosomal protein L11 [Luxibacter massiliensis]